eukprot:7334619-Prorocentrum_lima.AAC.1
MEAGCIQVASIHSAGAAHSVRCLRTTRSGSACAREVAGTAKASIPYLACGAGSFRAWTRTHTELG